MANQVQNHRDINPVLNQAKNLTGVEGLLVIMGEHLGAWGRIELSRL
jgi:ApbE superfamily uncharacterized protein (UPF0280 family)